MGSVWLLSLHQGILRNSSLRRNKKGYGERHQVSMIAEILTRMRWGLINIHWDFHVWGHWQWPKMYWYHSRSEIIWLGRGYGMTIRNVNGRRWGNLISQSWSKYRIASRVGCEGKRGFLYWVMYFLIVCPCYLNISSMASITLTTKPNKDTSEKENYRLIPLMNKGEKIINKSTSQLN